MLFHPFYHQISKIDIYDFKSQCFFAWWNHSCRSQILENHLWRTRSPLKNIRRTAFASNATRATLTWATRNSEVGQTKRPLTFNLTCKWSFSIWRNLIQCSTCPILGWWSMTVFTQSRWHPSKAESCMKCSRWVSVGLICGEHGPW